MLNITFTDGALAYLKGKNILNKILILIVDDGGGKYSIKGGSCSIGSHFSIIWVNQKDPDYPLTLKNNQDLKIYTSSYDQALMGPNMICDYESGSLNLRDDEGLLDGNVEIGNGAALIKANKDVNIGNNEWHC